MQVLRYTGLGQLPPPSHSSCPLLKPMLPNVHPLLLPVSPSPLLWWLSCPPAPAPVTFSCIFHLLCSGSQTCACGKSLADSPCSGRFVVTCDYGHSHLLFFACRTVMLFWSLLSLFGRHVRHFFPRLVLKSLDLP